ncbi:Fasciclin-domain-containing protein [Teratosphaeria destructans]|uniref:Fasciclin-domain-containing protein n=1 Tax=Teratosphaeria destructans TaxID=418781 RepID=A0A9W7T0I4_9PEZI|nr:Fasciclin-domain-containing protein [Teratosphaeria destructans]
MQFKTLLSAALVVASTVAQETYGDHHAGGGLADLLSSQPDLSTLAGLISGFPDLVKTLNEAKDITIFAPSNKAFEALDSTGKLAELTKDKELVEALLTYHVVHGVFEAKDFKATPQFPHTFLADKPSYTRVTAGQVVELQLKAGAAIVISGEQKVAKVTQADIKFGGGVIHVVGSVLSIPPKPSVALAHANFESLLESIKATGLTETIDEGTDLTIFAPTNAAFRDLGTSLNGLSKDEIANILKYHVIVGKIGYSSELVNGSFPTLQGASVTITTTGGKVYVNAAEVVIPDLLVSNGVVHAISSVLDPKNPGAPPCPPKIKARRRRRA